MAGEKTIMLLPTISEARILREALGEWINNHEESAEPETVDVAFAFHAKLSAGIRDSSR